jgi:hypothetical protein
MEAGGEIEESFQDTMRLHPYFFKRVFIYEKQGFSEMFGMMPNFEGFL